MLVRISDEFKQWLEVQSAKTQQHVADRLRRIEVHDHFGDFKFLGEGLSELRFKSGVRIYFYRTGRSEITAVIGGNKNGQEKDIRKAKNFWV